MAKSPFLKSVEEYMRVQRYSSRTIDSYLYWIKYFIVFNGKRHPSELDDKDIKRFLTFLVTERNVSASTQALALNAINFLKTKFLGKTVGDLSGYRPSQKQRKLPDALARKYPNAPFELGWHYLFPASRLSIDPESGCLRRHHFDESNLNKLVRKAARDAGIRKAVSYYTASLLCHPSIAVRRRYTHGSTTAGPCIREDNRNLHPCAQAGSTGGSKVR